MRTLARSIASRRPAALAVTGGRGGLGLRFTFLSRVLPVLLLPLGLEQGANFELLLALPLFLLALHEIGLLLAEHVGFEAGRGGR